MPTTELAEKPSSALANTELTLAVGEVVLPVQGMLVQASDGGIEFANPTAPADEVRQKITEIGLAMLALDDGQMEPPVEHEFMDGVYIRRMFIPKGTLLVGKIHRQECLNVVEQGDIAILTETGAKRVKAGFTLVSPAGIQKVGYANEDTVFTNVFRTDEKDVSKLEALLTCETHADLCQIAAEKPLAIEGA